jgi:hypothetical protein
MAIPLFVQCLFDKSISKFLVQKAHRCTLTIDKRKASLVQGRCSSQTYTAEALQCYVNITRLTSFLKKF